jgi:hypothetical protein
MELFVGVAVGPMGPYHTFTGACLLGFMSQWSVVTIHLRPWLEKILSGLCASLFFSRPILIVCCIIIHGHPLFALKTPLTPNIHASD